MANKMTKRALLSSVMALFVCLTMLVGTTFAWFTDSVTSSGNKIVTGNLDVKLLMHNGTDYVEITNESAPIFGKGSIAQNNNAETLWEPNKTQIAYLAIENAGSLDLKYKVVLDVYGITGALNEVMQYAIAPDAMPSAKPAWDDANGVRVEEGLNATAANDVELKSGVVHYFALLIHMDKEAGNEYMDEEITFDIKVLATQLASEEDSFGPDYDATAGYPGFPATLADLRSDLSNGGSIMLMDDIEGDGTSIVVPAGVTAEIDLNGKTISNDIAKSVGHVIKNEGTLVIKNGTISSTAINGGSAILNNGTLTIEDVVLNGAPIQDGGWPSYGINNYGMLTINGAKINTYHGGVATGGDGVTVINDADIDVGQGTETNQTSWAIYAYENAQVTVNGGTFANTKNEYNQVYGGGYICTSSTKSMIINGGTFNKTEGDNNGTGLYYNNQNLVINGGTFDTNPTAYAKGDVVNNGDGTWTVKPFEVSTAADLADKLANGSPVVLTSDVAFTSKLTITKDAYIDANGKTIKFTSGSSTRFIDVPMESLGADLTIKNAVIDIDGSYCERGINYNTNGILTLDNVTLTGTTKATYGINLPAGSSNATVNMTNCNITAHIALNVWGENVVINVTDCNLSNYDNNSTVGEDYNTIKLNNDGTYSAEGSVIIITGGTITAKNELGADFAAISNSTATGAIVVSDTTVVNGTTVNNVAIIRFKDGNGNFYGEFYDTTSLQAAVTLASNATNAEVFLLTDINVDTLDVPANVTIHKNGHDLTIGATTGSGNLTILD